MYPASSSSSSQGSMGPSGLIRYGSAPGSFLTTTVDSVVGPSCEFSTVGSESLLGSRYFSSDTSSLTADSTLRDRDEPNKGNPVGASGGLQRSLGLKKIAVGDFATVSNLKNGVGSSSSSSSLVRHSSSPAGFLNHLSTDNGLTLSRGMNSDGGGGLSRLNSQLSFTRKESLPQISEKNENIVDAYATVSFGMGSWDDANSIMFSAPPSKRAKDIGSNIVNNLSAVESQFQFSLPQTALEMATMEKLLQIPQDSVPCKARAKRGCATHPRSIAERERRTRISGKLKKLQDLVPNMDKQTSYADMLDFAVNHIKGLQNQVQKLNKELDNCTCGCNETTQC